jgi:hypothetical protein
VPVRGRRGPQINHYCRARQGTGSPGGGGEAPKIENLFFNNMSLNHELITTFVDACNVIPINIRKKMYMRYNFKVYDYLGAESTQLRPSVDYDDEAPSIDSYSMPDSIYRSSLSNEDVVIYDAFADLMKRVMKVDKDNSTLSYETSTFAIWCTGECEKNTITHIQKHFRGKFGGISYDSVRNGSKYAKYLWCIIEELTQGSCSSDESD